MTSDNVMLKALQDYLDICPAHSLEHARFNSLFELAYHQNKILELYREGARRAEVDCCQDCQGPRGTDSYPCDDCQFCGPVPLLRRALEEDKSK